ncbi:hypothetical protein GCM10027597_26120 [Saccharopolyspora tripterygii]
MSETVIVSTSRSPIGRAVKGSLKDMRPDDLAVEMVQAALAKVPELDPAECSTWYWVRASRQASLATTWAAWSPC